MMTARYSRRNVLKRLGGGLFGLSLLPSTVFAEETVRVRSGESIQAAVDRVEPGGTVLVEPGTYTETVIIEKPLRLVSEAGYAETVIQADRSRFTWAGLPREKYIVGAVNVRNTKDVTVDGFTLLNALEGLWVSASRYVLVQNCMSCAHQSSGYYFWGSQDATLLNSEGSGNAVGVYQGGSVNISILNNLFTGNRGGPAPHLENDPFPGIGILLGNVSSGCQIAGNHVVDNTDWGIGIGIGVTKVNIVRNVLRGNRIGAFVGERGTLLRHNNITANSELGLEADLDTDARENWWGSPAGPGDAATATALVRPWLEKPQDIPNGFAG